VERQGVPDERDPRSRDQGGVLSDGDHS
jgi:hypothetical protein